MEVHPPSGHIGSFKEALVHIAIITVGILIALGLDGLREQWREHAAVKEARATFQEELRLNNHQLALDLESVSKVDADIDKILADMPSLGKTPDELRKRVVALSPTFYFFRTTAWESAMSSGAIAHMDRAELNRFVDAYLSVKNYQDASHNAFPSWIAVETFFQSRHSFSASELSEGEERLRAFKMGMQVLEHLGGEMQADIKGALGDAH